MQMLPSKNCTAKAPFEPVVSQGEVERGQVCGQKNIPHRKEDPLVAQDMHQDVSAADEK
jgi:hypothetical protein